MDFVRCKFRHLSINTLRLSMYEGRALVFDLISLHFVLSRVFCSRCRWCRWCCSLPVEVLLFETRYQQRFRYLETDSQSMHQMRLSGNNNHFKFCFFCVSFSDIFVYFHWRRETWKSQCWIGCNWQRNGIACIADFGCLHKSPPKLKFHNKAKWSHFKRSERALKSRNKTKCQIKSNKDSLRAQSIVDPFM